MKTVIAHLLVCAVASAVIVFFLAPGIFGANFTAWLGVAALLYLAWEMFDGSESPQSGEMPKPRQSHREAR